MTGTSPIVDVQDMVCAQALPVVAKAVKELPLGGTAEIRYNTADVQHDLVAWARQVGHITKEPGPGRLYITRGEGPAA